jgi:hypothetical protein
MALSTVIFVGESKEWLPEIVEKARKLKCGNGMDPATEVRSLAVQCVRVALSMASDSCALNSGLIFMRVR